MVKSLFGVDDEGCNCVRNFVRVRRLAEGYLLTNDYGSWVHLNDEEYLQFRTGKMDMEMQMTLKDKGFLLDKGNFEDIVSDYRRRCSRLFQGTSLHIVIPTLRCNLRCKYCHAKSKSEDAKGYDMDEETAKQTVDFIFQGPSRNITIEFQGGEPLLNFDIVKEVVKYAKIKNEQAGKHLWFSIVTNLTLMDEEKFKYLKENDFNITTSLDGPKRIHDSNREDYEKTVEWIKKINEDYRLNAMLLVTKNSLAKHKEIVDEYVKLGLKKIWIKPVNKLGSAIENDDLIVSSDDFLKFYKDSVDYVVEKEVNIIENYTSILLKKILTKDNINFTDLQSPCGAAIDQIAYDYDGKIYTCDEGRQFEIFNIGKVADKYSYILTGGEVKSIVKASINDNPACDICAYKPYCGVCPVCSYAETGNVLPKLPNERCRIFMGMFDYVFEKLLEDGKHKEVFLDWLNK
ncbi:His-Xaa-Ser system radical SAM maturase HxsB [Candidatus Woesearchaeota archaeon]|nr:His-Xaa-Ser system radical SAM maturase HxsB [Candidatus Woesearchaeota archaeon]